MSEQREADYYTGVETGIDLYQARMFAAEQRAAELNTQLQHLRAAVQSEVEYLETRAAEVEQFKQHRDADFEKWLKSRHGRRPVGAEGIELAAVVPQSAARRLREALHGTPDASPGERRLNDSVETRAELREKLEEAKWERDSYKESAESWSTRAAQEQLRAERAEQEWDNFKRSYDRFNAPFLKWVLSYLDAGRWAGNSLLDAVKTELLERDAQLDAARQSRARLVYGIREWRARLIHYGQKMDVRSMLAHGENHRLQTELDAARQSRARLVQLWNERGISARSWHASERTWKP